jgi:hypothetical protein
MFDKIGNKYFRFSPKSFLRPIDLDGISKVEILTLQEAARKMIKNSSNKIRRFCKALGMEVIETSYDLYTGLYSELISIVDEIKSCEINQNEKVKANQIKLKEKIKDFTFIHDGIKIKNKKIYTLFKSGDQICYSCKSLAIGYLPAFEILKPENFFNDKQWGKTIHNCIMRYQVERKELKKTTGR